MATTPTHILRTDSGGIFGIGHLRRCLSLADAIVDRGGTPEIQLGHSDPESDSFARNAGHQPRKLAQTDWFKVLSGSERAKYAILDFSHAENCAAPRPASEYCRSLRDAQIRTLLIDGKGDACLSARQQFVADVLAIPYAGAEDEVVRGGATMDVRGLDYFVIDSGFRESRAEREVRGQARRVLVTAGGSDPYGLSVLFIEALSLLGDRPLDLHIVIGPAFSSALIERIEQAIARCPHLVRKVTAPSNLSKACMWADVALSASGLTKYELAYCGVPALLLSIDADHANANIPYAALGACEDLGLAAETSTQQIADRVSRLLNDPTRRRAMSQAGRNAVDGGGANRLLDLLEHA